MNPRSLEGWSTREHMERVFHARARDLAGPNREGKPLSPETRRRLNDRFERRMADELAGAEPY